MKEFYKIISDDNRTYIMYDSNTDLMVQVTNKNISYSKGKLFGWQDSTKEEFEETYQKLLKKIDDFVKQ